MLEGQNARHKIANCETTNRETTNREITNRENKKSQDHEIDTTRITSPLSMNNANPAVPVREQRKAQTRSSLINAAQKLFAEKGYDETTLEQVAELAGLHVQTLYRHFAHKHELAAAGDMDQLDTFRVAVRDPARTDTTFEFWREWVRQSAQSVSHDGGKRYRLFIQQRYSPPMVSSDILRMGNEYEDLLTESLARDFGMEEEPMGPPRLAAIMLWGANVRVMRLHAQPDSLDLVTSAVTTVDAVEAHFSHLLLSPRASKSIGE